MHILLDEDVPIQTLDVLGHVLRGHTVSHVSGVGWSGKKDRFLLQDAAGKFDAILTNDHRQLENPDECSRIKKSGLHHISYSQKHQGMRGLALSVGAIVAAMPAVTAELADADGQRLVRIHGLDPSKRRFDIRDPRRDSPAYCR